MLAGAGIGIAGLAACSRTATDSVDRTDVVIQASRDAPFRLRVGETARLAEDGLLIAFRSVDQDSRCPSDVTCVWSGDAAVRLDITVGRMAWTASVVHTHLTPRTADFRGYTIRLVELSPYPVCTSSIDSREYVATLEVTRAS